jgi:UDP-3-O-acyl-N-acetylglucosamine deacetylase
VTRIFRHRGTLADSAEVSGLGIRTGRHITVRLEPAEALSGITVTRSDLQLTWPADLDHALDVPNSTCIGDERGMVAFVEHVLAALWATAISDVRIIADGPEIPLLDGSALPWYEASAAAGRKQLDHDWRPLELSEPIFVLRDKSPRAKNAAGESGECFVALRAASTAFSMSSMALYAAERFNQATK